MDTMITISVIGVVFTLLGAMIAIAASVAGKFCDNRTGISECFIAGEVILVLGLINFWFIVIVGDESGPPYGVAMAFTVLFLIFVISLLSALMITRWLSKPIIKLIEQLADPSRLSSAVQNAEENTQGAVRS